MADNRGCSRRTVLRSLVGGSVLFPGLIGEMLRADEPAGAENPLAPRAPHYAPKAKRVIFLYMSGGVSHVDSFDKKPRLFADEGKQITSDWMKGYLKRPLWEFKQYGKCGMEVSDLFPKIGECADDICLIRSMTNSHNDHVQATLGLHTGSVTNPRPSMGSWVSYGLGTFNQKLPSFVVLAPHLPYGGALQWANDFLPVCHAGLRVIPGSEPVAYTARKAASDELQKLELEELKARDTAHLGRAGPDSALSARIKSFETAFGMQMEAPDVFDLSKESDGTLALYGLKRGVTTGFGWQCLVARRLAERGVRFVELVDSGSHNNWDAHFEMSTHAKLARNVDQPIAGLLADLKARGMLRDTLVVWATEFGRAPFTEKLGHKGREHHMWAFSSWLAGAGVKPGLIYGETDEHGIRITKDEVHVHDFHATILHLLGMDHEKLTFRHAGRDYRLTDVAGRVVKPLLS